MSRDERWTFATAAGLGKTPAERLRDFPREPDLLVYGLRTVAALVLRAWLRVFHRLVVRGRDNLPSEAFVMIANHQSHLDAPVLVSALPLRRLHRVFPAAAKDYFFSSLGRSALAAIFVNALPFGRDRSGRQSLRTCNALLATPGNVLVLFPEGTRSRTGEIGRFLPGIGMILGSTGVPVVPCHLAGCHAALPKGSRLPRPHRIELTIGKAMRFGPEVPPREIAATLERAVRDLAAERAS
ncbi:MAG: 1-acyl-sn-glycerol-3-phosphate acyltransferase [Planctomycetes bacterium]|nr:1-acyl-sn-glycerol-3-phosphate acyltransferase [Planctomycetota bacterium]